MMSLSCAQLHLSFMFGLVLLCKVHCKMAMMNEEATDLPTALEDITHDPNQTYMELPLIPTIQSHSLDHTNQSPPEIQDFRPPRKRKKENKNKKKNNNKNSTAYVSMTDVQYPFLEDFLPSSEQSNDWQEGSGGQEEDTDGHTNDTDSWTTETSTANSSSVTPTYDQSIGTSNLVTTPESLVQFRTTSSQESVEHDTFSTATETAQTSEDVTSPYMQSGTRPTTDNYSSPENMTSVVEVVTTTIRTTIATAKTKPTTLSPTSPCPVRIGRLFFPERFITDTQLLAKWTYKCSRSYVTYSVTYTNVNDDSETNTIQSSAKNLTITGLKAFTSYNVCVCAVFNDDSETCNKICNNVTTQIGYPEPPHNITIVNISAHSMRIGWNAPTRVAGPTNYTVLLISAEDVSTTSVNTSEVTITNLTAFTRYCVTVEAVTEKGGHSTAGPCNRTSPDVPGKVLNLKASCQITNCSLSWMLPLSVSGYLESYHLSYIGIRVNSQKTLNGSRIITDFTGPVVVISLDGLLADADHTFLVQAKTKDVEQLGEAASCVSKTNAGVPSTNEMENSVTCLNGPNRRSEVTVTLKNSMFTDDYGEIIQYVMIVSEESTSGVLQRGLKDNIPFRLWSEMKNRDEIVPYVTTPYDWDPFCDGRVSNCSSDTYVIGGDTSCYQSSKSASRCNGPLRPSTTYRIKIRAYTSVGFAESELCVLNTDYNLAPMIIVTMFSLILLTLYASALTVCIQRKQIAFKMVTTKTSRNQQKKQSPSINVSLPIRAQSKVIQLCDFVEHFKAMVSDSGLKFSQEFEELSVASPALSTKIAQLPENKTKNRWINILPFDDSRVKLLPIPDDVSTDYINASYIPGYRSPREYIATQGPLPSTKDDFWRMIWEQSSPMIVMVTQCVERGKVKCEEYWPSDREKHYYGDLAVRLKSESILSGFTIRIFDLELGTRITEVKQMHFTMWPDFGCPESTTLLLNFVRSVRDHIPRHDVGPVVIHCSAGVGRTGAFIAVDRLMQHVQANDFADVYGTVLNMRHHRTNMVQTEDQYVYIHECIKDLLLEPQLMKPNAQNNEYAEQVYTNLEGLQQE